MRTRWNRTRRRCRGDGGEPDATGGGAEGAARRRTRRRCRGGAAACPRPHGAGGDRGPARARRHTRQRRPGRGARNDEGLHPHPFYTPGAWALGRRIRFRLRVVASVSGVLGGATRRGVGVFGVSGWCLGVFWLVVWVVLGGVRHAVGVACLLGFVGVGGWVVCVFAGVRVSFPLAASRGGGRWSGRWPAGAVVV